MWPVHGDAGRSLPAQPVIAEGLQARQRLVMFGKVRGDFAADDVVRMADGETLYVHMTHPGVLEVLDPVRRETKRSLKRSTRLI